MSGTIGKKLELKIDGESKYHLSLWKEKIIAMEH